MNTTRSRPATPHERSLWLALSAMVLGALGTELAGCHFVAEGMPESDSSSSSSNGDDPSATTTLTSTTVGPTSGPSTTASSSSDEAGSSEDDGTFGDDATTTHGESSTGEVVTDFALAFDGASSAISTPYDWQATDFTVEAWIEIRDEDATGIIVDEQDVALSKGWVLYVHPDWHAVVFSFFDGAQAQQLAIGPAVADVGIGWHHVAATKDAGSVTLHVDGAIALTMPVSATMSIAEIPISVGDREGATGLALDGITIDDVRISDAARYDADFDAPVVFEADEFTAILLDLDEGEGTEAIDAVEALAFTIESAQWVTGHD